MFLAAVCFTLYSNCLQNEFLFDEQWLIRTNPYIHDLKFFPEILRGRGPSARAVYRPFLLLAYSIIYSFGNLNPLWYHLAGVALYALNVFLIFIFVALLFRDRVLALLTAVLFAVHPMHSKDAAIAADMPFVLEGVFILLSVILFLRYLENKRAFSYLLSLVFFILAVLSRESGLLAPLLIVFSAFACGADKKKTLISITPFFLLGAAYFLLRQTFVPVDQLKLSLPRIAQSIPPFFYYCHKYIQQLIAMPYGFTAGPLAAKIINAAAFIGPLLFYGAAIRFLWLKDKIVIFGCLFFFAAILPLLNLTEKLADYGPIVFDHYAYQASLGVILIFAYFFRRLSASRPKTAFAFFAVAVLFYSGLTVRCTDYYKNQERYYGYILSFDKDCAFAHSGLANIYYEKGMLVEAENEAKRALRWRDKRKMSGVYTTLGSIYSRRGELDKGAGYFRQAIELEPRYNIPYTNLALIYVIQGKTEQAERGFQESLRLEPKCLFTLRHFSRFLEFRGRYTEAIDICARILELEPDDVDARLLLSGISYRLGRFAESELIYKEAVNIERKNNYQGR